MRNLYIIAGPNGAGKTVASYTILPEIFNVKEFVNADEIARGISPFNSDKVGIKAGRLLVHRVRELLKENETFAVETTLATRSYVKLIEKAKKQGYEIILLFMSLNTKELAIKRVKTRVEEGGHNIALEVIQRRFRSGLKNLVDIYIPIVDRWILVDNSGEEFHIIAQGDQSELVVKNEQSWSKIKAKEYGE
ncbi:MAG: zeta toxin [Bacteroidetes bacterium]|nr:MAG: zeta toxin [Bacteroidota bacterium]